MERFPALDLVVRFGGPGAILLAVAVAAAALAGLWPVVGWIAAPVALAIGALAYLISKSAVEIVTIVTEMLVPR